MAHSIAILLTAVAFYWLPLQCNGQPTGIHLPPARVQDILGTWIGYLPEHHLFYRLELESLDPQHGGAGYLAVVYSREPAQLYRVTGWRLVGPTEIEIPLDPVDPKAYPMRLRGQAHAGNPRHLFLEVSATVGTWRSRLVMYREQNYTNIFDSAKSRISNARNEAQRP